MKILAMYLPQFHRVKENDEWWGEGFTDWEPTRNAKPLCEGHYQPHVPLNENYYDLLNVETMKWQAGLMSQYGIDGLCFYHYYFKDGKKILEKPSEILLRNSDIDMPFCMYWANESWKRSWSRVPNANSWQIDEKEKDGNVSEGLLLNQQYGNREDWIAHFNYLLPFFKDERYIKVDGKPLFMIYRTALIPCLEEMIRCFRECAKINGFEDLYIIGAYFNRSSVGCLDGCLYHEPPQTIVSLRESGVGNSAYSITYERVAEEVLKQPAVLETNTYFSFFTGFDDTPRRGRQGNALIGATPEKYEQFLKRILAKSEDLGSELVFINAWNEWGEGMHLEPDEKYKYAFLEATKNAKDTYLESFEDEKNGLINPPSDYFLYLQEKSSKFEQYMRVLDRWMELREKGINVCEYFEKNGIFNVAIYGYGNIGKHLLWELEQSNIHVEYIIDRLGPEIDAPLRVFSPKEELPECEAVVVTTFWYTNQIRNILTDKFRVISLDEIIMLYFQDK